MTFLITAAILAALLLWYAVQGRAWLKRQSWAKGFFDWIEPIELALFKKSETLLFARLKIAVGVVLTVLTQVGSIDLTPIMPLVPDAYESYLRIAFNLLPLTITVVGMIDEHLRKTTTKPLELVAVSDTTAPPAVKAAIAEADAAKDQAVAVVEAKAA
jgi:hypothetical protein